MKKSFFFVAALVLTFAACNKNGEVDLSDPFIGTLEEAAISPKALNSEFFLDATGTFESGNFIFKQVAMPASSYFSCNVVSNHTDTEFKDWKDAWKSAKGGAHSGCNYIVWNKDYYGNDTIKLKEPAVVPGFYVTNSIYAYTFIVNGEGTEYGQKPFEENDWFKLTITGVKDKVPTGSVEFLLAEGKNAVLDWTYVDLSQLGEIDGLCFALTGSRTGEWGLDTPAYFAFDDLGAKKD